MEIKPKMIFVSARTGGSGKPHYQFYYIKNFENDIVHFNCVVKEGKIFKYGEINRDYDRAVAILSGLVNYTDRYKDEDPDHLLVKIILE